MSSFKRPRRFWSKVDVGDVTECWEWQAQITPNGYGRFGINYSNWYAHRVAWVLTFGPIPEGLFVCHRCDNPSCCNPYHLFLGTNADNMIDAARKRRLSNSKLTEEEVLKIQELYLTGGWKQRELADKFGVSRSTIGKAITGKRWGWIERRIESS